VNFVNFIIIIILIYINIRILWKLFLLYNTDKHRDIYSLQRVNGNTFYRLT